MCASGGRRALLLVNSALKPRCRVVEILLVPDAGPVHAASPANPPSVLHSEWEARFPCEDCNQERLPAPHPRETL